MAKKIVGRSLSEMERSYIREHYSKDKMSPEDLYSKLEGVSKADIDACLVSEFIPKQQPNETPEEHAKKIANTGITAGKLMARNENAGVVVMTEAASTIGDARRITSVPSVDSMARSKPDSIHVIDPSKRIR